MFDVIDSKIYQGIWHLEHGIPMSLRIYPTQHCNNTCPFCCVPGENLEIDYLLLSNIIKIFKFNGGSSVYISGGEPTLYSEWDKLIKLLQYCNLEWAMTTNGTRLSDILPSLINYPPKWIRISVNAGTPETYRKIHGGTFSYNKLFDNFKLVIKMLPNTVIGASFVITDDNYKEIPEYISRFDNINVKYIRLAHPIRFDTAMYEVDLPDNDNRIIFEINRFGKLTPKKAGVDTCWYSKITPVIGGDGWLYPCCLLVHNPWRRIRDMRKSIDFSIDGDTSRCNGCSMIAKNKAIESMINKRKNNYVSPHDLFI